MTCTSQNHFLISIGNSHDLKSQQSKARPSNILWKISVLLEVCIFPADVNLQRLRDRAFSIHGGQAGYMVVLWELLSAAGFRRTAWWRPPQGISRNVVFFSCMHLNVNNMWSGFAHSLSRSFLSTIARSPFRPFDYLCLPFFLSCHLSCNPFFSYSIFLQLKGGSPFLILSELIWRWLSYVILFNCISLSHLDYL